MKHRIRSAALVVEADSLLLVKHQHDEIQRGRSWWVPPGGGVEGDESLVECAQRETLEETGLRVGLGRIVYVREFVEPGYHHCELFFMATWYNGPSGGGSAGGSGVFDVDHLIKEARFVRRDEMAGMTIFPPELKTTFWDDLAEGYSGTRYLGVEKSDEKTYLDIQVQTSD